MAVVIHDFEVEVQAPAPEPGQQTKDAPAPVPSAQELESIMRRQLERYSRIYAH